MSRTIRIASLIWGASILLSKLVGLVRESVIGRTLGSSGTADVYWAAFVLPDFLNYLLAGGALSIVFIPLFQAHLQRKDEESAFQSFSAIANVLTVALLALTALLWGLAPLLSPKIAPGLDAAHLQDLTRLTRIILPAQIFHLLGGLLSATLQARDHHSMPALAPIVYTGSIVLAGLLFGQRFGADAFAYGVLVGSILGPFGLCFVAARRHGLKWDWRMPLKQAIHHPDFKRYLLLSLPIMIGLSVVVVDDWMLKHFGSKLGEGAIAELQYARTLMHVPMGVFGLAAGVATFPTLTRLYADGHRDELWATLTGALKMTLFLAIGSQVVLTLAGPEIARLIWGLKRFETSRLMGIGVDCGLFCIGLWAWAAQSLVARGFYAQGKTFMPVLLGTAISGAFFPVYSLLAHQAGTKGLALASSSAISVYLVVLLIALQRSLKLEKPCWQGLPLSFLKMVLALGITLATGLYAHRLWVGSNGAESLTQSVPQVALQAAMFSCGGGLLFVGICALLKLPELQILWQISRRIKRKVKGA